MRRRLGFIFQDHNLFRSLTACQNVKAAAHLANLPDKEAERRAVEMLTTLGLGERLYYRPDALSGG